MRINNPVSPYALGSTDAEHERLIRQAARLAPLTERLFREAGIGPGQRVLDLGSGVGDVAMLVARLVGPSGEVVGIERDTRSIARARARVVEAGLHNVSFTQSDVNQIQSSKPFDAAVGRFRPHRNGWRVFSFLTGVLTRPLISPLCDAPRCRKIVAEANTVRQNRSVSRRLPRRRFVPQRRRE